MTSLGRLLDMFPETTSICIVPQFRTMRMFAESAWNHIRVPVTEINSDTDGFHNVTRDISQALGTDFRETPALHVILTARGQLKNSASLLSNISGHFYEKHHVCVFVRGENSEFLHREDYVAAVTDAFLLSCGKQHALVAEQVWQRLQLQRHGTEYMALLYSREASTPAPAMSERKIIKPSKCIAVQTMVLWNDAGMEDSVVLGPLLQMFPETTAICVVGPGQKARVSGASAWPDIAVSAADVEFGQDNASQVISKALGTDIRANPALHVVLTGTGTVENSESLLSKISAIFSGNHQVCVFVRENSKFLHPDDRAAATTRALLLSCGREHALAPKDMWGGLSFTENETQYLAFLFCCRRYCLRTASLNYVPNLCALERDPVPSQVRLSSDRIATQIKKFPAGQYVVSADGKIIAVLYTFHVNSLCLRGPLTRAGQPLLHNLTSADCILLVALRVHPDHRNRTAAVGKDLLDLVQIVARTHSFSNVFGVTRTRDFVYRSCPEMSTRDYVHEGTDPLIQYHVQNGATIARAIDNFWETDIDNAGAGVLIAYKIDDVSAPIRSSHDACFATTLKPYLEHLVWKFAVASGCDGKIAYDRPLVDCGLDSFNAIKFRSLLCRKLCNARLPETILCDFPTIRKIVRRPTDPRGAEQTAPPTGAEPTALSLGERHGAPPTHGEPHDPHRDARAHAPCHASDRHPQMAP